MAHHLNDQSQTAATLRRSQPKMNVLQGKRILYVEDDARNRSVVQIILQHAGATVEFERWGFAETAIPKINDFRPHLILLDLMFPANVSGYDIFDALRDVQTLKHIPVVAVSASDPEVEIPKAKSKGLNGFIGKPINIEMFAEYLVRVLAGETVWEAK
jgi:two-component system cell cycle response regulator DivK